MIGEKLGDYTVVEVIGSGSMGTVYRAEDPEGRPVAVKLVRSQVLYSMEKRERFLQCLLAASELRHSSICPILEIGDENDDFFVIVPLIQGKTLEHYLDSQPAPWRHALDIMGCVGSALSAIHRAGAIHRGLKPANIWILDPAKPSILLSDCCIARFTEIPRRGRLRPNGVGMDFADTLIPLNALAYMSPEQVRGESLDHRTDIFSFGVVLYEMLSGRHPFEARSSLSRIASILEDNPAPLGSRQRGIPPGLEPVLQRALAKNRTERYQSIEAMLADLQAARQKVEQCSERPAARSGIRRWLSRPFAGSPG